MIKKIVTPLILAFSIRFLGIFLLLKVLSHYIGIKVTVLDTLLITIGLQLVTFTIKLSDE